MKQPYNDSKDRNKGLRKLLNILLWTELGVALIFSAVLTVTGNAIPAAALVVICTVLAAILLKED